MNLYMAIISYRAGDSGTGVIYRMHILSKEIFDQLPSRPINRYTINRYEILNIYAFLVIFDDFQKKITYKSLRFLDIFL